MAPIPTFSAGGQLSRESAPFYSEKIYRQDGGDKILRLGINMLREEKQRRDSQWVSEQGAKFRQEESTFFENQKLNSENPDSFAITYTQGMEERIEKFRESAPSARALDMFNKQMNNFSTVMQGQALSWQTSQIVNNRFLSMQEMGETMANNVKDNPNLIELELQAIEDQVLEAASDLPPDKQKQLKAMLENKVARGYFQGLIKQDPEHALEILKSGAYNEMLTQTNKEVLENLANAEINKMRAVEQAQLKQELRELQEASKEIVAVFERGLTPEGADTVMSKLDTIGGKEANKIKTNIKKAMEVGLVINKFNNLSLIEQDTQLNKIYENFNNNKITGQQLKIRDLLQANFNDNKRAVEKDAYTMLVQQGHIEAPEQLDVLNPESLSERQMQYEQMRIQYGDRAMPLTETEIKEFSNLWKQIDVDARQDLLQTMSQSWSEGLMRKFGQKISPNDPTLGYAISVSHSRPEVTNMILSGQEKLKNLGKPQLTPSKYMPIIGNRFLKTFPYNTGMQRIMIDTSLAVYAELSGPDFFQEEGGSLVIDEEIMDNAARIVMGGELRNGEVIGGDLTSQDQLILPPKPGMSQDEWDDGVSRINNKHLQMYGKTYNSLTQSYDSYGNGPQTTDGYMVTSEDIKDSGTFVSIADGKYIVQYSDGFLTTQFGDPWVLDMKEYFNLSPDKETYTLGELTGNPAGTEIGDIFNADSP